MAETISDEQRAEMREIFRHYDEDNSGSIDCSELRHLMEALGAPIDDEECAMAVQALDADGSGKIEFDEFVDWWAGR
jgi:Ca2+-binding EF-hand superfamily protein